MMPEDTDSTLDLYLWPAGDCDCMLLKTPAGYWGLIDCGLSSLNLKLREPERIWSMVEDLKDFLVRQGIDRLAFVQLSHPELDHAKGMYEVLRELEFELFCTVEGALDRISLTKLKRLVESRVIEGRTRFLPAVRGLRIWHEPEYQFELLAMGPAPRDLMAFVLSIKRKLPGENQNPPNLENINQEVARLIREAEQSNINIKPPYNRLSIITLGIYGHSRLLLGADALAFSWRDLAKTSNYITHDAAYRAHTIKLPHHGASDGLPVELASTFLEKGAVSLVSSSGHSFASPSAEILEGFTENGYPVYCTGRSNFCPGLFVGRPCAGLIRVALASDGSLNIENEKRGRFSHPGKCRALVSPLAKN